MLGYGSVALGCVLLFVGILGAPPRCFPDQLVFSGNISYGLYVFRLLGLRFSYSLAARLRRVPTLAVTIVASRIPIAFVLTVVIACLSYRFFETPFLRIKERFTFVKSRKV
jgi:peptidoglycan/LPS O-acetylase OafA/YrhL